MSNPTCTFDGCDRPQRANKLCAPHARHIYRYGAPRPLANPRNRRVEGDSETRFWSQVARDSDSKCWEWQAGLNKQGYGMMRFDGPPENAHRISWKLANGRNIPPGMCVMHSCDNRRCVNPAHLSLGTHEQNMADMVAKGRSRGRFS
jgi:hypothetical protein